ncbi:MAG: hypothetical protein ACHQO8_14005 [Vicinamibacterales bacterium]
MIREYLGRDIQSPNRPDGDRCVVALIDASVMARLARAASRRVREGWYSASTVRAATRVADRVCALPLTRRIRLSGVVLLSAVATHLLLTEFSAPAPTLTARAVWLLIVAWLLVVTLGARAVAAAWIHWPGRRLARHERGQA